MTALTAKHSEKKVLLTILMAWLIAGTMDITAASTQFYIKTGKGPGGVLRYVASGFFGTPAFAGGTPMALWGLLFHYIAALGFAVFFFVVFPYLKKFLRYIPVMAIFIGAFAWTFMISVVIPLSNVPPGKPTFKSAAIAMSILIVCIGLPIAWIYNNYYKRKIQQSQ
jgi:hypothetical protein